MPGDKDDIVNFEALDLEGVDGETPTLPQKLTDTLKFLKEKLSTEDYAEVTNKLGVKTELTNEDLLKAITSLLAKKKEEDEDEDEDGEKMASYKDFMSKCMKEGKSLKECADEWKKKYPEAEEPSKEEQSFLADLEQQLAKKKKEDEEDEYPGPEGKKMKALEEQVATLTKNLENLTKSLERKENTAELATEVNKLVEERHLAPSQKDAIIKLAANMREEEQEELLDFFRTTQKLSGVFDESGRLQSSAPGATEITPERREELMETFKINEIIEDRGVRRKKVNN